MQRNGMSRCELEISIAEALVLEAVDELSAGMVAAVSTLSRFPVSGTDAENAPNTTWRR